jgi:cell division protein FtsB
MQFRVYKRLDWVVTVCSLALLGYIGWQVQQGPRGYGYLSDLTAKAASLQAEHEQLCQRNKVFEDRVQLLRPESVDPDLIDELARRDLALADHNDLIVQITP